MTNIALPTVPADAGLAQYFREAWSFPMLGKDEEQQLAIKLRDEGDVDAAHRMVTSHLRLVCKIAMGYRGYGLPVADLISEGNIGLMKAVKKFDPDRGFRLSTYAMWWIKAAITEYILKSWSLVKLGTVASQKKLFFSLRNLKSKLGISDQGELTHDQALKISDASKVAVDDVVQINRRLSGRDVSLNAPVSTEDDSMEFLDTLVDEGVSPEASLAADQSTALRHQVIADALKTLPERERHIFTERRLTDEPMTLEALGEVYGISRERVRQLEVRAFGQVEDFVRGAMADGLHDNLFAAAD